MNSKTKAYAGLAVCFLIYTFIYMGRQNLSMAAPLMEQDGIADKAGIGLLGSLFFYIYAFGRLFNGWLGDRMRPKVMLMTGFITAGLCNLFIGFCPPLTVIFILWSINGFFQSTMWGSVMAITANIFENQKERQKAIMILGFTIGLGGIITVLVCTGVSDWGFRWMFLIPGIIILAISAAGLIILPDVKQERVKEHINMRQLLRHRDLVRFIIPIVCQGVIKDNLNLWVPIFFTNVYNINIKEAALYIFVMPLAVFAGKCIFPILYRLCRRNEISVAAICYVISILALIPIALHTLPIFAATALMFVVSALIGTANTSFSGMLPLRFFETGNIASTSGVIDFLTYLGSATGAAVFGFLISRLGFASMIWVWVLLSVISAVLTIVFRRDYDAK